MRKPFLGAAMLALGLPAAASAMSPEDRQSYQQMLLLNLPNVPSFDQWVLASKELPPDFDALPRHNDLPDPLTFLGAKPVKTPADWPARRAEILALYQKYLWGQVPPLPKFDHIAAQDVPATGYRTRLGNIFAGISTGGRGPGGLGTIRITMQIPDGPGPFPVVMGPSLIGAPGILGGGVAPVDVIRARGYIVCSIAASEGNDDSPKMLAALYPDADPGTLPRRGWAASAVVDYLLTLPEVDAKRIAITGASRDAQSMTIAAALDPRISAIIANSPGIGGILPFRLAGEINQTESLQSLTMMYPDAFHPRARYFVGREDRLPVDGNLLLAALAPRPFLLVAGINDEASSNFGDEQSLHSANKTYQLLGDDAQTTGTLGILRIPGNHGTTDWPQAMRWLDAQFGNSDKQWVNHWIFNWDWDQWKSKSGETVDLTKFPDATGDAAQGITTTAAWEAKSAQVRKQVEWMLGDASPAVHPTPSPSFLPALPQDVPAWVIARSTGPLATPDFGWYDDFNGQTAARAITFNSETGGIKATLYYPAKAPLNAKLPAIIWLHSASDTMGYMWAYHREVHPILALVDAGYAVLAYDQSGFGTRMNESATLFDQTPHGSQMGRMVADARAAVSALSKDAQVKPQSIYLFGYGLGGSVALYTAALEPKVAGVVSISGFTPMRTDTANTGAGGITRYALDRPLLPRLGFFIGHESKIPYDDDALLGMIAPRPLYVVNPLYDRGANFQDVHAALGTARKIYTLYAADDHLKADEPYDYNRLAGFTQDRIILWMRENMR